MHTSYITTYTHHTSHTSAYSPRAYSIHAYSHTSYNQTLFTIHHTSYNQTIRQTAKLTFIQTPVTHTLCITQHTRIHHMYYNHTSYILQMYSQTIRQSYNHTRMHSTRTHHSSYMYMRIHHTPHTAHRTPSYKLAAIQTEKRSYLHTDRHTYLH